LKAIETYQAKLQAQKELEERQEEEKRKLEEAREAERKRQEEEKRKLEEAREAERKRQEEEKRKLEEAREAERKRQEEEKQRQLEEQQKKERDEQQKRHLEEQRKLRREKLKAQLKRGAAALSITLVLAIGGFFGWKAINSSVGKSASNPLTFVDDPISETDLLGDYYGKVNQEIISLEIFIDRQNKNALRYKFIGEGSRSYPLYVELTTQTLNFNLPNRGLGKMQISKHPEGILLKNESVIFTKNNP
jgi:DNA mismatch repair ATPase MutL